MNSGIKQLISFLQNSPTAAHCVEASVEILKKNGFRQIFMDEEWKLNSGEKCMVVDSDSTVAAFIVGRKPAADTGFRIIGTHTDAPPGRLCRGRIGRSDYPTPSRVQVCDDEPKATNFL